MHGDASTRPHLKKVVAPAFAGTCLTLQAQSQRVLIKSFFDGGEFLYRLVKALSE